MGPFAGLRDTIEAGSTDAKACEGQDHGNERFAEAAAVPLEPNVPARTIANGFIERMPSVA